MASRRCEAQEVLDEVGIQLPRFSDEGVAAVLHAWTQTQLQDVSSMPEGAQERAHLAHLTDMIEALQLHGLNLPAGVKTRKLIVSNNRESGFTWNSDEPIPHDMDEGDFRCDAAIVNHAVTEEHLAGEGGFSFVHVPIELAKTTMRRCELGQIGAYSITFRAPGSRYQVGLGIQHSQLFLFLLSPTGWARIAEADYTNRNKEVSEILAFCLSDAARDDTLVALAQAGIPLKDGLEVQAIYDGRGKDDRPIPSSKFHPDLPGNRLPRPFFSSEMLYGARSQAWALKGRLINNHGEESESEEFIVISKLLRKGKAVNSYVFSEGLKNIAPKQSRARWFEESLGINIDEASFKNPASQRVRVVEILRGPRLQTWDEAMSSGTLTVVSAIAAFRACLLVLWSMRPLHHRDVSISNLLLNPLIKTHPSKIALDEAEPTPLPARLFDYGNARWGSEPSDIDRRHAQVRSISEDDSWTGTYHFLSRAALYLDRVVRNGDNDENSIAERIRSIAQHHHWHDAESLFFCFAVLACSRFQRFPKIKKAIDDWLSAPEVPSRRSWLPSVSDLRGVLRDLQLRSDRENEERDTVAELLLSCGLMLREVADTDGVDGILLATSLFADGPRQDAKVFGELLAACNTAITRLNEIENSPDVGRLSNTSMSPTPTPTTRETSEPVGSLEQGVDTSRAHSSPNKRSRRSEDFVDEPRDRDFATSGPATKE